MDDRQIRHFEEFEDGEDFVTFADIPPDPLDDDQLSLYADLGLNNFILTEDDVKLTKDGQVDEKYLEAIEAIGKKGLGVFIRNMFNDADYFVNDDAEKERSNYGTPYRIPRRKITDEFQKFGGIIKGFYMSDEAFLKTGDNPATSWADESKYAAFDQYFKLVEWKNKYYPDKFWHQNHVPSSSWDHYYYDVDDTTKEEKQTRYRELIDGYIELIVKNLRGCEASVCLDNYPYQDREKLPDHYLFDILTCAVAARDHNRRRSVGKARAVTGICVQAFRNTSENSKEVRQNSVEDFTFQLYTGMACGVGLFEYFCYKTVSAFKFEGIVEENCKEKIIFDLVKEANKRALPMAKVVRAFEWQGAFTSFGQKRENKKAFDLVDGLTLKGEERGVIGKVKTDGEVLVGCFKKGDKWGYMFVNYSNPAKKRQVKTSAEFTGAQSAIVYREGEATEERLTSGVYEKALAVGEGVFVIPNFKR